MKESGSFMKDRHLRLTLRVGAGKAEVLEMRVVDEPLVRPGRVVGPFVVSLAAGGEIAWVDSMTDPLVRRGVPRKGEREHHYSRREKATVVTRVPLPQGVWPKDFRLSLEQATGPLPERVEDLEALVRARKPGQFERVASVDLPRLEKHPDWSKATRPPETPRAPEPPETPGRKPRRR